MFDFIPILFRILSEEFGPTIAVLIIIILLLSIILFIIVIKDQFEKRALRKTIDKKEEIIARKDRIIESMLIEKDKMQLKHLDRFYERELKKPEILEKVKQKKRSKK
ncbi:MAG: hypothetical protein JW984_05600 [Deltaproteobacteria bacterium]|uniref:Uncharacterized protein n=1 Tax=Candidatus Zymogenus saltonus TaxID=2844893 RepID=A0A9D8PNZ5_9DELT|nr:hypothetical protein [Candidatus Zymogenus saltonus]